MGLEPVANGRLSFWWLTWAAGANRAPPDNWKYNAFRFRECNSSTISKTDCAASVDLFRAEKIATVPDQSHHDCRFCGAKLTLVRTIMESESGVVIHTFECEWCGDRTWTD